MNRFRDKRVLLGVFLTSLIAFLLYALVFSNPSPKENEITEDLGRVQTAPTTRTISGEVQVSGYIPSSSTLQVLARRIGESNFEQIYTAQAKPRSTWAYTQAEDGTPYEVKAQLTTPQGIYESELITVVAPAQNESIRILSKSAAPSPDAGDISGTISINGVIPQGATITLAQKTPSSQQFNNFGSNIQAKNGLEWNWNTAKIGNTYEIIAYLVSGGAIIGTSNTITTTAPATGETLVINSQNTQSTARASISGTFDINGVVPDGSYASIGIREPGQTDFELLGTNITARDEVGWSWNSAESGQVYEVQSYITTGDTPIAQSQILTVTAPATEQILVMNVDYAPNAPSKESLTFSCVEKNNKDKWQVRLTMNADSSLKNVAEYHLQFGTVQSITEYIDSKIFPTNSSTAESLTTDYIMTEGTTYYSRYAYQRKGFSEFSPFTQPQVVTCQ